MLLELAMITVIVCKLNVANIIIKSDCSDSVSDNVQSDGFVPSTT